MEQSLLDQVTPELKADPIAWPILEKMTEKDVPSVLKSYAHGQHRLGSALMLPGKDTKPEDLEKFRAENLPKLYQSGILQAPPTKLEEYGIAKPEKLPEGMGWNDELAGKLGATLLKHGASKALAGDLMALYGEALTVTGATLKTSYDQGMSALKAEYGDKFEPMKETATRLASTIFKTPEELAFFEKTGLGNHPAFLSVLMRLAPLAVQDSSFLASEDRPGGEMSGDDVRAQLADIMNNKENKMHEGYIKNDPAVHRHIDELYRKAYGNKKIEV